MRLIRAKKPWALAASALLMLGFTGLFLGDYRVLAKVDNEPFHQAVGSAKSVAEQGAKYQSDYDAATGEWKSKYALGQSLVIPTGDRGKWAKFLQQVNAHLPDPVRDYKLDPNKAADQPKLDRLRVHIDAIKPVWRNDVAADWFKSRAPRRLQEPDAPARSRHAAQRRRVDRPDRRPPLQPQPHCRGAEAPSGDSRPRSDRTST